MSALTTHLLRRTVFEEIGEGADVLSINGRDVSLRAYCSQFNFKSSDQQVRQLHLFGVSWAMHRMCS